MSKPRFNAYRSLAAKFAGTGTCGHPIKAGDVIGYARQGRESFTRCPDCWSAWQSENADADRYEASFAGAGY